MKANELRVGNYVKSKEWHGCNQIEGIELFESCFELKVKGYIHKCESGKYFDIAPISLTVDWLRKFGFKQSGGGYSATENKSHVYFSKGPINIRFDQDEIFTYQYPVIEIKSVHQLQNLHYALTGEDLIIKT